MKKIILLLASVSALFVFSACMNGGEKVNKDAEIEMAFPANPNMLLVLDYENEQQREQFTELLDRFPETDLFEDLRNELISDFNDFEGVELEDDFWESVSDDGFKLGFSFAFAEGADLEDLEDENAVELVVAADFGDKPEVEEAWTGIVNEAYVDRGMEVEQLIEGEVKYWSVPEDDFFMTKYGDIYFVVNSLEVREEVVQRLAEGSGFYANTNVKYRISSVAESNLGYAYFDFSEFLSLVPEEDRDAFREMMEVYGNDIDLLNLLGDFVMVLVAEDAGLKMITRASTDASEEEIMDLIPDYEKKPVLIKKVNGESVIFYTEDQNFGFVLGTFLKSYGRLLDSAIRTYENSMEEFGNELPEKEEDLDNYTLVMGQIGSVVGLEIEELEELFDTPFAMSVSNEGQLYPALAFYLDLDDETKDLGLDFSAGLNSFVEDTLWQFQALLPVEAEGAEVIKKERLVIEGGILYRLYIDWSAFSEETLAGLSIVPGFDLTEQKVEFYFGVTGNNLLVFALYPDFDQDFAQDVLAENPLYKEGVEELGESFGYNVSFMQTGNVLDLVESYVDLANSAGFVTSQDLKDFELFGRGFAATVEYVITSKSFKNQEFWSDVFVRIKEV